MLDRARLAVTDRAVALDGKQCPLKQFRGLAKRYEKWAVNYWAMVVIASLVIRLS